MNVNCNICPRNCPVDRQKGELGYCHSSNIIKVSKAALHMWEEPCISGTNGSGTVFFTGCNLSCVFCQNHNISQGGFGKEIGTLELSKIFNELQEKGAHNINLVTPTHYANEIIEALKISKKNGLTIPILYNTNSYENPSTIKALDGLIDVYLPDLKYFNDKYSIKYSNAKNYFNVASKAICEMISQVGSVAFDENGLITKGVIVRHMVLPGLLFDSKKILDYLLNKFGNSIYISIMSQYTPMFKAKDFPEINKKLNIKLYDSLVEYAALIGIDQGFIQENSSSSLDFIPKFDLTGI